MDDEINILKSIARSFLHAGFEIFTATSARDALNLLDLHDDIDIVVTDYRMPSMDGFQFLNIVREKHPKVSRVILSGYIEKSAAVESLTRGIASTYILKPWTDEEFEDKILHILETRKTLKSNQLLAAINRIETLPTLSNTYRHFIDAVEREKSMTEITRILQRDPSVSTKVLHVANSAYYGLKNCTSVNQAAVTIGLDTLHDILLTLSVIRTGSWKRERIEDLRDIFVNSFIMNNQLPDLYRKLSGSALQRNFPSVGLTYDVGKIVLLQYFPERFERIRRAMEGEGGGKSFHRTEMDLGFAESTHQEIGAFFLDFWNLPAVFVETALFHHEPRRASVHFREMVEAVGLIDTLIDSVRACGSEDVPAGASLQTSGGSAGPTALLTAEEVARVARGIRKMLEEHPFSFPI